MTGEPGFAKMLMPLRLALASTGIAAFLPRAILRLGRVGYGFGTKRFPGISNILRIASFERNGAAGARDEIGVLRFELDDQTPEDLAIGLDRLRAAPGVLDVQQSAAFGKKGRMVAQIQVLAALSAIDAVAELCLAETTTLGVRIERIERRVLARESATLANAEGGMFRVPPVLGEAP